MTPSPPDPDRYLDASREPVSEQLLLDAVRGGSMGAFGILYTRHRDHAMVVARSTLATTDAATVEDVVESAFIRVLGALRNGNGPTDSLRYYLATTVRREAWRWQRRGRRQAEVQHRWSADETPDRQEQAGVTLVAPDRNLNAHALLAQAFSELSDSWRQVLWLTEVEGRRPADLAPLLGLSPGSAAALAYRARQGLLRAYFEAFEAASADDACRAMAPRIRSYVAAGRSGEGYDDVLAHLEGCGACRDVVRGVDVAGEHRAVLPLGLLSFGLWAHQFDAGAAASLVMRPASLAVPGMGRLLGAGAGAVAAAVVAVLGLSAGFGQTALAPPAPEPVAQVASAAPGTEPDPSVRRAVSGRVTSSTGDGGIEVPLPGVVVALFDEQPGQVHVATTDGDGRWTVDDATPGRYRVDAVVDADYRPIGGSISAPGSTWTLTIGQVELAHHDVALGDLRVVQR